MRIEEIKRNNFYTNGEIVVYKTKDEKRFLTLTEPENDLNMFCDRGVDVAYIFENQLKGDFRKVEKNETFYNGAIEIIDSKNVKIFIKKPINAKYDDKGYIINSNELKYEEKTEIKNISDLLF